MRLGLLDQTTAGWSAGAGYTRTVISCLELARSEAGAREWVFLSRNPKIALPEGVRRVELPAQLGRAEADELCRKEGIQVVLPVRDFSFPTGAAPTVGWIPDFQHLHLPELFRPEAVQRLRRLTQHLAEQTQLVLLSSQTVAEDFRREYPAQAEKIRVAGFASTLWQGGLSEDPRLTAEKYHLPERFALVANQFWRHKNHAVLPGALRRLAEEGMPLTLVLTGLPADYRDAENTHLSAFFQSCARHGVAGQVVMLGHLPYSEMIDLMRSATLVIQPSLFEGWSTSIEDAKALGKPLICSDLAIHREQVPDAAGFFSARDESALATAIARVWKDLASGWNVSREAITLQQSKKWCADFGEKLWSMAEEALGRPMPPRVGRWRERLECLRERAGHWRWRWHKQMDRWLEDFSPRRKVLRQHWMKLGQVEQYPPRALWISQSKAPQSLENLPELAVVTPSYQQVQFLRQAIESVLEQRYPNLRYAILDGGSTDGSAEVVQEFADRVTKVRSAPDGGQAAALKEGFANLGGEIMGWLNADDLWLPGALRWVGAFFRDHPKVDLIYGNRVVINEAGQEIGRWILPPHEELADEALRRLGWVPQETMFWRRALYDRVGGIDPDFRFAMDWDLFLRLRKAGAKIAHLPHFLGAFRVHGQQKNAVEGSSTGAQEARRLQRRELGSDEAKWQVGRYYQRYRWAGYLAARDWENSGEGKAWRSAA